MPAANVATYLQLADETASHLTYSHQEWTGFLRTAARLYKYPYHEQLMIYAQRPDATACAEYDLWNNKMRRYVRRGSKGIALVDNTGGQPKLRYVFDIADTGKRENSVEFQPWALTEENAQAAALALERGYDVPAADGLERQIHAASTQLARNYWFDHQQEIIGIVDGSFLEGYDEFNVGAAFRKAASVSLEYALLSRCGLEPDARFEHEDFLPIFDWNTPEAVAVLGTAVSEMSEEVLRTIEISVRNYERSHEHERDHLSAERRLSDPQPDHQPNGASHRQIRQDAERLAAEQDVSYERFSVIETDKGYAIWDDLHDGYYVDEEGVTEEFPGEWQAESYLEEIRKAVQAKEAAEWDYIERAKVEPSEPQTIVAPASDAPALPYSVGDTLYLEEGKPFIIEQIGSLNVRLRDPSLRYAALVASTTDEEEANRLSNEIIVESKLARESLAKKYGFTYDTFSYFTQAISFEENVNTPEESQWIVSYRPLKHEKQIGNYEVRVSAASGDVLETAWSLDNIYSSSKEPDNWHASVWKVELIDRLLTFRTAYDQKREEMETTLGDFATWSIANKAKLDEVYFIEGYPIDDEVLNVLPGKKDISEKEAILFAKNCICEKYGTDISYLNTYEQQKSFFLLQGQTEKLWVIEFHSKEADEKYVVEFYSPSKDIISCAHYIRQVRVEPFESKSIYKESSDIGFTDKETVTLAWEVMKNTYGFSDEV